MNRTVIIGGGMAGLGAAYALEFAGTEGEARYELYERETRLGGLCRTEEQDGFLFDYTGHLLHFRNDYFRCIVTSLIGDQLEQRTRSAWIYSKGVFTRYPYQANLYGLPSDVIVECIYEYSRQHFAPRHEHISTFAEWITAHFGEGIGRHFMVPYNRKLYRRHPAQMTPDCMGRFVPQSDLKQLLRGAVSDRSESLGYNSTFLYPAHGGIEALVRALAGPLHNIHTGETVERIELPARRLHTSRGEQIEYGHVISTQPITQLVKSLEGAPPHVHEAADRLKHVGVLNVNLGIRGTMDDRHWVYVPEERFAFHRMGFPVNFSRAVAPEGHGSIYLEISYDPAEGIDPDHTVESCIKGLLEMGIVRHEEDIVARKVMDLPFAYVVYDSDRAGALAAVQGFLREQGIYSVGRFGAWEYTSMEDAFMQGVAAARDRRCER